MQEYEIFCRARNCSITNINPAYYIVQLDPDYCEIEDDRVVALEEEVRELQRRAYSDKSVWSMFLEKVTELGTAIAVLEKTMAEVKSKTKKVGYLIENIDRRVADIYSYIKDFVKVGKAMEKLITLDFSEEQAIAERAKGVLNAARLAAASIKKLKSQPSEEKVARAFGRFM